MGNDYICSKEAERELEVEIQALPVDGHQPQDKPVSVQFLNSLPNITEEIAEAIACEKPFQQQLLPSKDMPIFKLTHSQIYHGFTDKRNLPHGFGSVYKQGGVLEIGQFVHGKPVGEHYVFMPDGSFYKGLVDRTGSIAEGLYSGKDFKYTGQFHEYEFHGRGSEHHRDYDFEGEYDSGKHVRGILKWRENNFGNVYRGSFNMFGQFEGEGTNRISSPGQLVTREGVYRGNFKNGCKEGEGVFQFANGLTYEGTYANDQRNGRGKIINSNQSLCYEGSFLDGLPHGHGKRWDEQGNVWEGQFKCGIGAAYYQRIVAQT